MPQPDDKTDDIVHMSSTLRHVEPTSIPLLSYGPHCKFSRGDEIYNVKEEYEMVQDKKFVCTLSLFLDLFRARCQTPGCTAVPDIKYYFVGMALFVSSTCKVQLVKQVMRFFVLAY